jgi:hypothetical protein
MNYIKVIDQTSLKGKPSAQGGTKIKGSVNYPLFYKPITAD